jgi:hypothetical protein
VASNALAIICANWLSVAARNTMGDFHFVELSSFLNLRILSMSLLLG